MDLAPIVLFAYNRPNHLRETITSLQANYLAEKSEIYIFADGAKATPRNHSPERELMLVNEVRDYLLTVTGFRKVYLHFNSENLGLANSVIYGVSKVLSRHSKVIVMEDDMVSSINFLDFMNQALREYENNNLVFSVSGYSFPISIPRQYSQDTYFFNRTSSWGWGTWADRWSVVDWDISDWMAFQSNFNDQQKFNEGGDDLVRLLELQMNGEIDSWSIRFDYACYKHNAYCVYPVISKIINIGTDGSGTHFTKSSEEYSVQLDQGLSHSFNFAHVADLGVLNVCKLFFSTQGSRINLNCKSLWGRFLSWVSHYKFKLIGKGTL